ncbi:putative epoxide hydrolase [Aspergillus ambiguus]|uniref:alpha/beta hydrolase n=1 Tax=Aspergillus ambiguus TaxID=176160 RepID=UPI003CCD4582
MASIAFPSQSKKVTLSDGTTYGYVSVPAQSPSKPTFLLLHGYPSSCYDWRHQIVGLQKAGYGVIAPDLLGYGDTDKPTDPSAYRLKSMSAHMAEILDVEGIPRAIAVGHDWGCALVSSLITYYRLRFYGFVTVAVGYIAPGVRANRGETAHLFGYWQWHNTDEAIADKNENPASEFTLLYPHDPLMFRDILAPVGKAAEFVRSGRLAPLPSWYSLAEYTTRDRIFANGGYAAPLCWYKAPMRGVNAEDEAAVSEEDKICRSPLLLIGAEKDYVCLADMQEQSARPFATDLRVERLDTGHWVQLEKPDEVNALLIKFAEDIIEDVHGSKM